MKKKVLPNCKSLTEVYIVGTFKSKESYSATT